MEFLWTWLSTIKAEWIGGFVGSAIVVAIKAGGPLLARAVTRRFQRAAKELDALAESERSAPLEQEIGRLQVELGLARRHLLDFAGVADDLRALANRNASLEQERDEWKARAEASARESAELRALLSGKQNVESNSLGSGGAGRAARVGGRPVPVAGRSGDVPTVPPSGRGGRPAK